METQAWAVLAAAFLMGALPTAYLMARAVAGVDIRTVGDGNMGARNVYLNVGPLAGLFVALVDVGKGAGAVLLARWLGQPDGVVRAAGLCAVLGHDFTPFLRFHGGQGMAAILGIFGVLYPLQMAAGLVLAAAVLALTRNWDLSWGVAFPLFALSLWFGGYTTAQALYPVLLLPTIGLKKLQQAWLAQRAADGLSGH